MSWNYEDKLTEYIIKAQRDCGLGEDYKFHVYTEQVFAEQELLPDDIYVVVKYLSTTNTLNATVVPIQILVLCEQNQMQATQIIFNKLVETHNFEAGIYDGTYVKQDYRNPVVLSNFNQVSYGYRSVIYISGTLFVMENVMDITDFAIKIGEGDYKSVKPINSGLSYSMTPNTQPIPPSKIATSVKSVATFSLQFGVPLISDYDFITTISNIMTGTTSGNTDFYVRFKIGTVKFGYFDTSDTALTMKLLSAQITTAINEIPSLQIGLIK